MPLLSVIIPAYQCAKTIEKTVRSIISQPCCSDIEIIIVDDGSSDGTAEVCRSIITKSPGNISYYHQNNSGVSAARNSGLSHATGEYIAFCDSDDTWRANYIDPDVEKILLDSEYDILVFSTCFTDIQGKTVEEVHVRNGEVIPGGDSAVNRFYHTLCAFIIKRKLLVSHNISFSTDLIYGEDELFRSQCLYYAGPVLSLDKIGYEYCNNPYSSTKMMRNNRKYAEQKLLAYYKLRDFFFHEYILENMTPSVNNRITARYLAEAIILLSETGYGYKKVCSIATEENISYLLENKPALFSAGEKELLSSFCKASRVFYVRRRLYGLFRYTAADIKHLMRRCTVRWRK